MTARLAVVLAVLLAGCSDLPESPGGGTGQVIDRYTKRTRTGGTPAVPIHDVRYRLEIRHADGTTQKIRVSSGEYHQCTEGRAYPACLTKKGRTK